MRPIMATTHRFCGLPASSFLLLGPRGTGKTTLLAEALPEALYVNLLRPDVYRSMLARPELLRERVLAHRGSRDVVIDEIQRVPELLSVVHDLIESGPEFRYAMTGSSARKLRRGGIDLLAGRAAMRTMHPFMAAEWTRFTLEESLRLGLVPLVVDAHDPDDTLAAYVALYLVQEVETEGMVRSIGQFSRFLEAVSFSHASVLNTSAVAREAGVKRKTVEGFLGILEDLLLAFRIPVFTRRAQRATAAHAKFYLFDSGVYRSLRPTGPLDRREEIDGAALEGLVAQHLRAWMAYGGGNFTLHTWRTRTGVEVDLIVYGSEGFWAIEVKNTARLRPSDLRGLRTFVKDYPEAQPLLLYRGEDRLMKNGILCLPVEEFLRELKPGSALPE